MTTTPPTQPEPDVAPVEPRPVTDVPLPDDDQVDDDQVKLNPGVTADRATGLVAVYDTRELRYVTGAIERDDQRLAGLDVKVTRTGRYQLRRV